MTLKDRVDLPGIRGPGANRLHRVVSDEMNNLKKFYETVDIKTLERFVKAVGEIESVYLIGSRISYTYALLPGLGTDQGAKGNSHIERKRQRDHRLDGPTRRSRAWW